MKYGELVRVYEDLANTTKRLEKTTILAGFLRSILADNLSSIMLLLQGRVVVSSDVMGVASQLIVKAIAAATGATQNQIIEKWKIVGDLGIVAAFFSQEKQQRTLFSHPLTTQHVMKSLQKLTSIEGPGSVDQKVKTIAELISNALPLEAQYIVRTVLGDLRIGVGPGVIRDAIVQAYYPKVLARTLSLDTQKEVNIEDSVVLHAINVEDIFHTNLKQYAYISAPDEKIARAILCALTDQVQEALDLTNDFGLVAKACQLSGVKGLLSIGLIPGHPVKVMLYQKAKNIEDAFAQVGSPCAFEYKYDGFRLCAHRNGKKITLFTRRLEDVTKQFPDVVEVLERQVKSHDFIIDCEVVGIDPITRKHVSFQHISQRIKRKHGIAAMIAELPVEVNVFDILELNGMNLIRETFTERRKRMESIVSSIPGKIQCSVKIETESSDTAEKFYTQALSLGYEGIMAKSLTGPYVPGSRVGYGVKIKPMMDTLDCVVVGAEWGSGKRAQWFSSFDLAVWDNDMLVNIGKASTGLKEKSEEGLSFFEMTTALQPLIIGEEHRHVKVTPSVILEVAFEEIQKSPSNSSGFALRFPRIIRRRDMEKSVEDADTLQKVDTMFLGQK